MPGEGCRADVAVSGAGLLPCLAVVPVPGKQPAGHHDQAGAGVGDDLVAGGVPAVLDRSVMAWTGVGARVSSHDGRGGPLLAGLEGGQRSEVADDPVCGRFGHRVTGAGRRMARFVRQYAAAGRARSSG